MGKIGFKVKTIQSFDKRVVEFKKRILDSEGVPLIIDANKGSADRTIRSTNIRSINIHEIEISEQENKILREITDSIYVELIPEWENQDFFYREIQSMIIHGEDPYEVLELSVRIVCPALNHVFDIKTLSLNDIDEKQAFRFSGIDLNDIKGNLRVSSELIRKKSSNPTNNHLAFSKYSLLAKNDDITFYVDEVDPVGGNALDILPEDTGNYMFRFKNVNQNSVSPPTLNYHKEFESFFNAGDDYKSVQTILLLIGFPYCDRLLRWILFGLPKFDEPQHGAIVKFIAEICEVKTSDLQNLSESTDYKEKIIGFIDFSNHMFLNFQTLQNGMKKNLYGVIISEKDGKS